MKYIVGLGNPGKEYEGSRHNVGRDLLFQFQSENDFEDFEFQKKYNALISEGKIDKEKVTLILPETFMNNSGNALKKIITSAKKAKDMIVVYDDLDLGLGDLKFSFNKSSGGHKGLASIIKATQTKEFVRLRIGISKKLTSGKIKKVKGEDEVVKQVLGKFSKAEVDTIDKVFKKAKEALKLSVSKGYLYASNELPRL